MSSQWRRGGMALAAGLLATTLAAPLQLGRTPAAVAQDGQKTPITLWFDTTGGSETAECIQSTIVEPFNKQSPDVQVNATMQANGWQATRTALAGGAGPDIVTTPGPSWAVELAKAGQLASLDQVAGQYGWNERFVPWALDLGKVGGTLYSLPTEQETMILYYNKTLFDQHGWTPPKTIDDMTALSQKIADAGIIPFAHGNQEWRPANHWYLGEFLNHVAGPDAVYDVLTGKKKFTDPEFAKAVDLLTEYQKNGWFMGGLESYYTTTQDEMHAALGDGQAAMLIEGTWFLSEIGEFFGDKAGNDNDWGWVPVPSTSGEPVFDLGIGSTYSINQASPHPEAAAKFLDYLFSSDSQTRLLTTCGMAPAPVKIDAAALEDVDPRQADIIQQLNKAAAAGSYGYVMWTFFAPKVDSYLTENIERVWAGEMSSQELLAEAQRIHDEEAAAGKVPPIPARGA